MEYIGYAGVLLLGLQLYPQIRKVVRTESTKDLSQSFLGMNVLGVSCILMYSVSKNDLQIYIPASISLFHTIVLLVLIQHYKRKGSAVELIDVNADVEC